jgi:DNA-binding MarR family transcriptional regulator
VWAARLRRYPAALAVSIVLSSYARTEDGCRKCWPSQRTIADVLGISDRAVRSALDKLEEVGFIRQRKRRFRKTAYCFIWDYFPTSLESKE